MATPPPPLVPRPDLVAVLVPGDGRYRFCSSAHALEPGDWVAVPGLFGPEPGRVAGTVGSVLGAAEPAAPFAIERRLEPAEVAGAMDRAERALRLTGAAVRLATDAAAGLQVVGLRFTLAGEAVCSCVAAGDDPIAEFGKRLSSLLDVTTHLERVDDSARFGGLGKRAGIANAGDARAFDGRLDRLGGWPRLGSLVRGAGVEGVLLGVSVRHGEARIRDALGQEHVVPILQLEP